TNLFQFVFTDFIYFCDLSFNFTIYLSVSDDIKIKVKLIERLQTDNSKRTAVKKIVKKVNSKTKISIKYKAKMDCVYGIAISTLELDKINLDYLDVRVQLVPDFDS